MRRYSSVVVAVVTAVLLLAPGASAAPASTWQVANGDARASGTLSVIRVGLDRVYRMSGTLVVGAGADCYELEVGFSSGGTAELARRCGTGSTRFTRDFMHVVPRVVRLCRQGGACASRPLSPPPGRTRAA
jgi:hypothetical protein